VVSFTYYAAWPISGAPMSCPLASQPLGVVLHSDGDSVDPLGSRRSLEVTAKLEPPATGAGAFDRTVFSAGDIVYDGAVQLWSSAAGDPVNVYAGGNFNCDYRNTLDGHVFARGTATLDNLCDVRGDVWATGAVTVDHDSTVGHDATSGTSTMSVANRSRVFGNAVATSTPTVDGTSSVGRATVARAGAPPSSAFPNVSYSPSDWTGWSLRVPATCPAAQIELAGAASWASPTLLRVPSGCLLTTADNSILTLGSDAALVVDGGITLGTASTIRGPGKLILLVPYGSSCSATAGRITMGAAMHVDPPLKLFAYTPCRLTGQGSATGQLYGGTVRFGDFSLVSSPIDRIPGYVPTSLTVERKVRLVAKREVVAP
jgi:hypothetical protein